MALNPEPIVGLYLLLKSNILTDTKSNCHCFSVYVGCFFVAHTPTTDVLERKNESNLRLGLAH